MKEAETEENGAEEFAIRPSLRIKKKSEEQNA